MDPRTGNVIAHVAEGEAEDINRAVSAARKAFDEGPWPKMTPYVNTCPSLFPFFFISSNSRIVVVFWGFLICKYLASLFVAKYGQERSCILFRFADLLEKHCSEIAALESWDNGKPYEQAANVEIPMVIRVFRYYAGKGSEKNS